MVFLANDKTTKVLEPGEEAFNLPTLSVSPQGSAILGLGLSSITLMRCDHLNATF
ncbi:hypothetical protein LCGC14_2853840, partial [marine sediment metagenome]